MPPEKHHRYTLDTDKVFDSMWENLANIKGVTKAEIIRRAVSAFDYLATETNHGTRTDRKVAITDMQDRVLKDVIIPF